MELAKYLEDRIAHLKSGEIDYFNKSIDQSLPLGEKAVYRNFSNELSGRRKELESLQKEFFNTENKIS